MVIDKMHKMSVKGVKLKSESFFSISLGVLELWRKTLGGIPPPVQIGLTLFGLGGGQNGPLSVFAKYLKNSLADLHQTL